MEGGDNSPHGNAAGAEIADAGSDVEGGYDVINVTPVDRRLLCLKCGDMFPVKAAYLDHVKRKSCAGGQAGTERAEREETGETPPPKPAALAAKARNLFYDPLELTLGVAPAPLPPHRGSKGCRVLGRDLRQEMERGTVAAAAAAAAPAPAATVANKEVGSASKGEEVDLTLKL